MKKLSVVLVSACTLLLTACGGNAGALLGALAQGQGAQGVGNAASSAASAGANILGTLASNATSGANLGNILASVIGLDKMSQANLIGTWAYLNPGCAFTSQKTLANAGGEVVAATCKEKLTTYYNKVGFKSNNTAFTFAQDGTFQAVILGKKLTGTYTFDEATQAINLNISLLGVQAYTLNGFVKQNSNGIALLFESKKILTILQTVGAMSGNATVSNITNLTSNYDGVRIGFDLARAQ